MITLDMLTSVHFIWPWSFLLLPLPLLARLGKRSEAVQESAPMLPLFETVKSIGAVSLPSQSQKSTFSSILLFIIWLLLIIAASRPTYIGEQIDLPLSGRDLMLAIDISPSMKETDMQYKGVTLNRLDVVKRVVTEFVKERDGDRIGLILFGSQPYIQSPLSFDSSTVNTLLQEAYLGMAGQATAIGDAIALGVKRLRQRPEQSRVLILLTDGANTAGDIPPDKAAQLAAQEKIKIYTVGIGADEMIKRSFFGARKVNPSADLDEAMLKQIASLTDGQYFRARNTEELAEIYEVINALEPIEQETRSYRPTKALYYWSLGLALVLYASLSLIRTLQPGLMYLQKSSQKEVN